MRLPFVLAVLPAGLVLAALAPATSCAGKPAAEPSPVVEKGRQVYAKYCATCHGPAANGYIADNAPSLRSVTFLESASDDFIRAGISRGRPGTAMAAFARTLGGPLDPGDVDAIIAFLRVGGPALRALPDGPVAGDAKRGKLVYDANCARCHGTATQRSSAVHLANPVLLATATDAFLHWAVERGRPPTSMGMTRPALSTCCVKNVVSAAPGLGARPVVPYAARSPAAPRSPRRWRP